MAILFVLVTVAAGLSLLALDRVYMMRQASRARRDALPVGQDVMQMVRFTADSDSEEAIFTTTVPPTTSSKPRGQRRLPFRSHQ